MEEELRTALRAAMRRRDPVATAALRSALGTLADATAVPAPEPPAGAGSGHIAGGVVGLGAAEVPRRELTPAEAAALLRAEVTERRTAAADHPPASAARLHAEADVLEQFLR